MIFHERSHFFLNSRGVFFFLESLTRCFFFFLRSHDSHGVFFLASLTRCYVAGFSWSHGPSFGPSRLKVERKFSKKKKVERNAGFPFPLRRKYLRCMRYAPHRCPMASARRPPHRLSGSLPIYHDERIKGDRRGRALG